ncbi:PD-(D/E)XK nuclease family protein [Megalodesulfovibrio paquesii]
MASHGRTLLIPWNIDAMEAMAAYLRASSRPLHEHLLVFPHRRPARHLLGILAKSLGPDAPPVRTPRMLAGGELLARLRAGLDAPPAETVSRLDRIHLLQQIIQELGEAGIAALQGVSAEQFFPWGVRLESLLEECFLAATPPRALGYMEEEVQPFAAGILSALDTVYARYVETLDARNWSTPGRDALLLADRVEEAAALIEEPSVLLVGFDDCFGVEELLFRHLWETGRADLILHGDPALAKDSSRRPHWSQGQMEALLARWGAPAPELLGTPGAPEGPMNTPPAAAPMLVPMLYEGYDLHSQLAALGENLRQELREHGSLDGVAVVISEPAMLLPVLHHLPLGAPTRDGGSVDVNVSLGYPLVRSTLAQLLELCMTLQETAAGPGLYHWRDLLALIRHPYLKMLSLEDPEDETSEPDQALRPLFHALERQLRLGSPMVRREDLTTLATRGLGEGAAPPAAHLEFLAQVCSTFLTAWEGRRTLAQLAETLHGCVELLLRHGLALWRRFPVDGECLHRLLHQILPTLSGATLCHEPLPESLLFAILKTMLAEERVPFEAEPLTGLQVMGVLESRLLPVSRLHLIGATDDALPGRPGADPLLPDALRHLLQLPDAWQLERRQAAVFFRCVEGARAATLYTQTGAASSGLMDEKKRRSRFVEEALWAREQQLGRLLKPGEPPLVQVQFPAVAPPRTRRGLPATPALRARLKRRLHSRPLSPTFLDAYMHCPARCLQEKVLGLKPQEEVKEEGDMKAIGEIVHSALQHYFQPRLNRPLTAADVDGDELGELFVQTLAGHELATVLRFDHRTATELAGRKRLRDYAAVFPDTTILSLETDLFGSLEVDGETFRLMGRLDRLDQRSATDIAGEELRILDYKTGGSLKLPVRRMWETLDWQALESWGNEEDAQAPQRQAAGDALLQTLASQVRSVQLPFYLHCARQSGHGDRALLDAALVDLARGGQELALFGPKVDEEERDRILESHIPTLLTFLVRHLLRAEIFPALPGDGCRHCPVSAGCLSRS